MWNRALTPIVSIAVVALIRELFHLFRGRPQKSELEQHYQRAREAEADAKEMVEDQSLSKYQFRREDGRRASDCNDS